MRKLIFILLLLIIPIKVNAESTINDINLTMIFPENWTVFTRDNIYNNEVLASYNITYEYLKNLMDTNHIYIDAVNEDLVEFFVISIEEKSIHNINNYKDDELKDLMEHAVYKDNIKKYEIIKEKDMKFLKIESQDNSFHIIEYCTVINKMSYIFKVQKLSEFTEEEQTEIENIIKTVNIPIIEKYREEKKFNFDWNHIMESAANGGFIGAIIGLIIGGVL